MHRLDSIGPARAGRSRLGRSAALVGGCSLAVAAAFALPAFAGGSAPPEQEDAVVIGCAVAGDGEAVAPAPAPVGPLPKGAEVLEGEAVPVTGSVTVPDGVTPAMPLPKGAKIVWVDAVAGRDGAKVVSGTLAGAPTGAPQLTIPDESGEPMVIEVDEDELPDCGTAAK